MGFTIGEWALAFQVASRFPDTRHDLDRVQNARPAEHELEESRVVLVVFDDEDGARGGWGRHGLGFAHGHDLRTVRYW